MRWGGTKSHRRVPDGARDRTRGPAGRLNLGLALTNRPLGDAVQPSAGAGRASGHLQARYLAADCQLRLASVRPGDLPADAVEASRADARPCRTCVDGVSELQGDAKGQLLIDRILRLWRLGEARVMMGVAKRGAGDLKVSAED